MRRRPVRVVRLGREGEPEYGWLLTWGLAVTRGSHERDFDTSVASYTVAIVEREDGSVTKALPEAVTFFDREEVQRLETMLPDWGEGDEHDA